MEKKNKFMSNFKLHFRKLKLKRNMKVKNKTNTLFNINIQNIFKNKSANKVYIILIACILLIISIFVLNTISSYDTLTLVKKNTIEYTTLANAYIIKDETVIEIDSTQTLIPILAEGKRVSKGATIAMYKNSSYDNYIAELEGMDNEILNLMKDVPFTYSSEIQAIDNDIRENIKQALGQNSYVKMQEYINDVNELINKRAMIIGTTSDSSNTLENLITQRNEYENTVSELSNNLLSPATGIVSYITDGLENILRSDNIFNLDYDQVENLMQNKNITSKIKVVNNFVCYLIARTNAIDEKYLNIGEYYKLKIIENSNENINAKLIEYSLNKDTNELDLKFELNNKIEKLINLRKVNLEICWWELNDMYVPNEAIFTKNNISYITLIKYGKYIDIPIKTLKSNESNVIISNYSEEELENLNIESSYTVSVYDKILSSQKNRENGGEI